MLRNQRIGGLPVEGSSDASAIPGAASRPGDDAALPLHRSLRGKGLVATGALLAYVFLAGLYVASGRSSILASVAALERQSQHEKALLLTEACIAETRADVELASRGTAPLEVPLDACAERFAALIEFDPGYTLTLRALQRSHVGHADVAQPTAASTMAQALQRSADELEIRRRQLGERREALVLDYQRQYDAVTVQSLLLATIGLALFGSLAAWFFAQLAGDIARLEAHARQIVHGRRGVALTVRRDDELGRLMRAVDHIAVELDQREQQLQLENERRAHQDKMLGVGALAAGIAHEVNNPLAAIIGTAQALRDASPAAAAPLDEALQAIVAQAERAARAARQLAEVAAPEPSEPDWIDLNAMLRRVVQLNGYDRRYRHLTLETALDPGLPALRTAGEALRQVLTQLLSMACDAAIAGAPRGSVLRLASALAGSQIEVELVVAAPLDYSRPQVQRSLLLCGALIEPQRGRLVLGQDAAGLQHLRLILPAATGPDPG